MPTAKFRFLQDVVVIALHLASVDLWVQHFSHLMTKFGSLLTVEIYILNHVVLASGIRKSSMKSRGKVQLFRCSSLLGKKKNDLLDYLRSLQPEKVAELSEPTSPELKDTMHSGCIGCT
ncbi:hypothetical protein SASPL_156706 [Salvia splendens]|uniref:Uncharacterized protein n=1 Tax=Salvia splendens TaxID=180675 RepID=A0A8X8VW75_SALSN|nr:hypothetical protein SASPL_156706 [Salvia splendens]